MANLTIRNVDENVVKALKAQAREHNRSLEAEVRQLLADAAAPARGTDLLALAERIAALTPAVAQTDSADLLRADRDR